MKNKLKSLLALALSVLIGHAWAADPVAIWTDFNTLTSGDYTLVENGNTISDGVLTIGSKPSYISGTATWDPRATGNAVVLAMRVTNLDLTKVSALISLKLGDTNNQLGLMTDGEGGLDAMWEGSIRGGDNAISAKLSLAATEYIVVFKYSNWGTQAWAIGNDGVFAQYTSDYACKGGTNTAGADIRIGALYGAGSPATGLQIHSMTLWNTDEDIEDVIAACATEEMKTNRAFVENGTGAEYTATVAEDVNLSEIVWTKVADDTTVTTANLPNGAKLKIDASNNPVITSDVVFANKLIYTANPLTVTAAITPNQNDYSAIIPGIVSNPSYEIFPAGLFVGPGAVTYTATLNAPLGYEIVVAGNRATLKTVDSATLGIPSFGVNFYNNDDAKVAGTEVQGAYPIKGAAWTDVQGQSSTAVTSFNLADAAGNITANTTMSLERTQGARQWGLNNTPSSALLKGYIDDSNGNPTTLTFSNIPYAQYRVIVYMSTDTANYTFAPVSIGGISYASTVGNSATATVASSSNWGHTGPNHDANALAEGVNYLVSTMMTDSSCVISAVRKSSGPRATIAAVQFIDCTAANRTMTLPGQEITLDANTNISDIDLTAAEVLITVKPGVTLTFDQVVTLDFLRVVAEGTAENPVKFDATVDAPFANIGSVSLEGTAVEVVADIYVDAKPSKTALEVIAIASNAAATADTPQEVASTIAIASGKTLKTKGYLNFSAANTIAGTLDVVSGVTTLNLAERGLNGTLKVAAGATFKNGTTDGPDWGGAPTFDIAGTLEVTGTARWSLSANTTTTLREGAVLKGAGGSGYNYAFDWFAGATINVLGDATIEGNIGGHDDNAILTFNVAEGKTLTIAGKFDGGTYSGNSSLAVSGAGTLKLTNAENNYRGTTTINASATLELEGGSLGTGAVTGAGNLVCTGVLPPATAALNAEAWTGTVKVQNFTGGTESESAELDLDAYGNANSVVELANVAGWVGNGTVVENLKLSEQFSQNYGSQETPAKITIKKLSGAGNFNGPSGADWRYAFFVGDCSEFTGSVNLKSGGHGGFISFVVGSEPENYDHIDCRTHITVMADGVANVAATWSPATGAGGMTRVYGTIGGAGSIASALEFFDGATIDGSVTATGNVTLPATGTVNVSGEAGATVLTCANAASLDLTKFAAPAGLKCVAENGAVKLAVAKKTNFVVTVGEDTVNCETFAEALEALGTAGGSLQIAADADPEALALTEKLTIAADTTIDLNGKTLTSTVGPDDPAIHVTGGTLTLTGKGSITAPYVVIQQGTKNAGLTTKVIVGEDVMLTSFRTEGEDYDGDNVVLLYGKATLESAGVLLTYSKGYAAIQGSGGDAGADTTITITGGQVVNSGDDMAIYHPQAGKLTITDGVISGETGIEMRAGSLVMSGGEVEANAAYVEPAANNNGSTVVGAAIVMSQHSTGADVEVTITGGSVTAAEGGKTFVVANTTGASPVSLNATIGAGVGISAENAVVLVETLEMKTDASGNLTLVEKATNVAKIGDTEYETLEAAFEAAATMTGPVTVTLLKDIGSEAEAVSINIPECNDEITFDMGGFKVVGGIDTYYSAKVTIKNGTIESYNSDYPIHAKKGHIVLRDITLWSKSAHGVRLEGSEDSRITCEIYSGNYDSNGSGYTIYARNYSDLIIYGGTFTDGTHCVNVQSTNTGKIYGGSFTGIVYAPVNTQLMMVYGGKFTGTTYLTLGTGYRYTSKDSEGFISVVKADYALTVNVENATVSALNATYQYEDEVSFTVTPATGYKVTSVKLGADELTADEDGNYSFSMPAKAATITVTTEAESTFDVTIGDKSYANAEALKAEANSTTTMTVPEGNWTAEGNVLKKDGAAYVTFADYYIVVVDGTSVTLKLNKPVIGDSAEGADDAFTVTADAVTIKITNYNKDLKYGVRIAADINSLSSAAIAPVEPNDGVITLEKSGDSAFYEVVVSDVEIPTTPAE